MAVVVLKCTLPVRYQGRQYCGPDLSHFAITQACVEASMRVGQREDQC